MLWQNDAAVQTAWVARRSGLPVSPMWPVDRRAAAQRQRSL